MKLYLSTIITLTLLLSGCGSSDDAITEEAQSQKVSGTKASAVALMRIIETLPMMQSVERPAPMMGVYTALFLGQGEFLPVQSAMRAIGIHMDLLEDGDTGPGLDETFTLLQDFGSVLQVDIVEEMNQSASRRETLDLYLQGLKNVTVRAERKIEELNEDLEQAEDKRKEERTAVRDIERAVRQAFKEEDYALVGAKQQELTAAEARLATAESEESQIDDIIDLYEDLMEIATERIRAIENNREILIAGLKVIEVPGIEDLGIFEEKRFLRDRSSF